LRVEIVAATKDVYGDVRFLYRWTSTLQGLLNDVAKKCLPPAAASKRWTLQQILQVREDLRPFLLGRQDVGLQ